MAHQISMFSSEELPAPRSQSREDARVWMTKVATWPSSLFALLNEFAHVGSCGRTSLRFIRPFRTDRRIRVHRKTTWVRKFGWSPIRTTVVKEALSRHSWPDYRNSGMAWRGECWMLNTSEFNRTLVPSRSAGDVCSLSDILETGDHLSAYFLSVSAAMGILRRAERRGKTLSADVRRALERTAGTTSAGP